MKVKLLKKIRKSYSIYYVESIDEYTSGYIQTMYEKREEKPFYIIKTENYRFYNAFESKQAALDYLQEHIKTFYKDIVRPKQEKITKVWY